MLADDSLSLQVHELKEHLSGQVCPWNVPERANAAKPLLFH